MINFSQFTQFLNKHQYKPKEIEMSPEISEPRDVSRIIKALERIFNEQTEDIRQKMIRIARIFWEMRKADHYYSLVSDAKEFIPNEIGSDFYKIIFFFEFIEEDDDVKQVEEFLLELLPKGINLREFMSQKLGLTPNHLYSLDRNHFVNRLKVILAIHNDFENVENFEFVTTSPINDSLIGKIIKEFLTENGYELIDNEYDIIYRAKKENELISITVTNWQIVKRILVSVNRYLNKDSEE